MPTIHVGCKGFGFSRLKAHLGCSGLQPVACVDIDIEGARENVASLDYPAAGELSERVYSTITEAAGQHDAKACVIYAATPPHAALTIESLGLGLHTLCVKPIATTQDEFGRVMRARREHPELVLVQGQNKRWNPAAVKMREWLNGEGGIGEMRGGECRFWVRLDLRHEGRVDALTEGLFFHAAASHQLDQLVAAVGLPRYVTAAFLDSTDGDIGQVGVAGTAGGQAFMEYGNGAIFSYTGTRAAHATDRFVAWSGRWQFHGTQRDLRREAGRLQLFRKGRKVEDVDLRDVDAELLQDERIQLDAFAEAVTAGTNRQWLEESTLGTWILMEACNESARSGKRVDVEKLRSILMD